MEFHMAWLYCAERIGSLGFQTMARTSTFTPEIGAELCARVTTRSLRKVCFEDDDMPAEGTVYGWLAANPAFAEDYARARAVRAYRRAEDLDEVTEQVRTGALEPNAGRVVIDAIKWQAGKEAPRVFGDKLELAGDADRPLQVVIQRKTGGGEAEPA